MLNIIKIIKSLLIVVVLLSALKSFGEPNDEIFCLGYFKQEKGKIYEIKGTVKALIKTSEGENLVISGVIQGGGPYDNKEILILAKPHSCKIKKLQAKTKKEKKEENVSQNKNFENSEIKIIKDEFKNSKKNDEDLAKRYLNVLLGK